MLKISIMIVEDYKLIREALAHILTNDDRFNVIGECKDLNEAIEDAKTNKPDIILLDIDMPGINSFYAIQWLKKHSDAEVICLSDDNLQPSYTKRIFTEGAKGYLTLNSSLLELLDAIIKVYTGLTYIGTYTKNMLSNQVFADEVSIQHPYLTKRETSIVKLIKDGFSSTEIAQVLDISKRTLDAHRFNILTKFKVKNADELINNLNQLGDL